MSPPRRRRRTKRQLRRLRIRAGAWLLALCLLAVLAQATTPGFASASRAVGQVVGRTVTNALAATGLKPPPAVSVAGAHASKAALTDTPSDSPAYYTTAAKPCHNLTWQLLAGIGKVESNHGRSSAPGVRSGVNRFGCCAGP